METKCRWCGKELPQERKGRGRKRIYCSDKCSYLSARQSYRDSNPPSGLANSTVGAISEYRVVLELLSRGFNVFRATSPACPCDLIISKNQNILRVEVTTGKYSGVGKVWYAPHNTDNYDIMAVVLPEKIYYYPEI